MTRATAILWAVAVACVGLAIWAIPPASSQAAYEDTGELLVPGFSDPTAATRLEVLRWDDKQAKVVRFVVERKQGGWKIPSHHDYPADATKRMAKAAAAFVDVKRDIYYGNKVANQAKYGVLDPAADKGDGADKGRRFIVNVGDKKVVDIIVGKRIPKKPGFYYVRPFGGKRVYGSRLKLDISTKFTDWIEKDLLRLDPEAVVSVTYDPYQVDEQHGTIKGKDPLAMERATAKDAKVKWALADAAKAPKGKTLDPSKIDSMVSAIDGLTIVGVRRRPQRLTLLDLQNKGFFVTRDGKLFGNEGEVRLHTKGGIVYRPFFGEVTFDTGLALTAGVKKPGDKMSLARDKASKGNANRFLFVDARYDPKTDATPAKDTGARAKHKKRGAFLHKRFSDWFYVISDSSFKSIHKDRATLFKAAPKKTPLKKAPPNKH